HQVVDMHGETGWIQALLVDKAYRGQGIGSRLLEQAEAAFESLGKKQILMGRDPFHYFPGLPTAYKETAAWLEKKGYVKEDTEVDLLCQYDENDPIDKPSFPEAEFVIATAGDEEGLLGFLERCFPGRWE